jgi:hypothetical protein
MRSIEREKEGLEQNFKERNSKSAELAVLLVFNLKTDCIYSLLIKDIKISRIF